MHIKTVTCRSGRILTYRGSTDTEFAASLERANAEQDMLKSIVFNQAIANALLKEAFRKRGLPVEDPESWMALIERIQFLDAIEVSMIERFPSISPLI